MYSYAPGSSPKHTMYAFIINSQLCAIFIMLKEQKEAGLGPCKKRGIGDVALQVKASCQIALNVSFEIA